MYRITDLESHDRPRERLLQLGPEALSTAELLAILINYPVCYISRYITSARRLCQEMLKRYIEIGRIEVPVPPYRGFHVRPSTLI